MRILLLTQWFQPEPFFKGLPFAVALQARGHTVDVVTGFPNYPSGRLYPGYTIRPYQREVMSGVAVHRAPLFASHSTSSIGRIANYTTFAVAAAAVGALRVAKPDIIYAYHPPATVGLPALLLAKRFRCPVVDDIQDLWPDTLRATGMLDRDGVLRAVGAWCQFVYRRVDHIVVLSPGFKRTLEARGVPGAKVTVIMNWAHEFAPPAEPAREPSRFEVLFAGNLGAAQGLETVVRAAASLVDRAPQVRFVLLGDGLEREPLRGLAGRLGATNVEFAGQVAPAGAASRMHRADALLVHLRPDPLFEITIPSKTQAYLEAGRPILMGVAGDAADLVRAAGAGVVFTPGDPQALAQAVMNLAAMPPSERAAMGTRGRAFYYDRLSQHIAVEQFDDLFRTLVDRRRAQA